MLNKRQKGDAGELEVVELVPCPNCKKQLTVLPKGFPLYDIQCTACFFRAQVKTNAGKPKASVLGAGWDIMDKVLKSGYQMPPIFCNFKWSEGGVEKHEIRFYPFIPRVNLRMFRLGPKAKQSNYKMFSYIGLDTLPFFVMYKK